MLKIDAATQKELFCRFELFKNVHKRTCVDGQKVGGLAGHKVGGLGNYLGGLEIIRQKFGIGFDKA
jgi:hypothetical protein